MTRTGSGHSESTNAAVAAAEAVKEALPGLNGQKPRLGFLFASPKHDLSAALQAATNAAPGTEFVGCHTAGEFTERGLSHGSVSVMLLSSDELVCDVQVAGGLRANHSAAAKRLCARFADT